jgi:hypothetical protein
VIQRLRRASLDVRAAPSALCEEGLGLLHGHRLHGAVDDLLLPEPERAPIAQALLRSLEDDREVPTVLDDAALEAELARRQ